MAVKMTKGHALGTGGRVGLGSVVGAGNAPFSEQLPFAVQTDVPALPQCVWLHRNSFDLGGTQSFFGPLAQIAPVGHQGLGTVDSSER